MFSPQCLKWALKLHKKFFLHLGAIHLLSNFSWFLYLVVPFFGSYSESSPLFSVYNRCNTMTPIAKCKASSIIYLIISGNYLNNPVGNENVPLFPFDTCSVLYIKYMLLSMLYCNMYQRYISLLEFLLFILLATVYSSILLRM